MKVVFFHRKPRPGNFSIENLFAQIRNALPAEVQWTVKEMKYFSNGLGRRLYSCLEAFFNQQEINHITGDIHFIALLLKRRNTVLTIHDLGLLNHPNRLVRMLLKWFWISMPVKRVAIVTTVSQATKDVLLKYVNVKPEKVRVVYNPVSTRFVPVPKQFATEAPVILQIGTKYNKNISRMIQAIQGLTCKLEIVGHLSEHQREELRKSGIDYRASENLTNEEIFLKYREADIISFVSTFEGFGMPIVEANAIGRVVVTSDISAMPEVAGDAACFVDPYSVESIRRGFQRVMEDETYRAMLIEKGFANARRFHEKVIAENYLSIYKELQ